MRPYLKTVAVLVLLGLGTAWADTLDDGVAAIKHGDYATALHIFRALAARGNAKAQNNLGVMYVKGQGVKQDLIRAYMWADFAAFAGDADAVENRDIIAVQMTPDQIEQAQHMGQDCLLRNFEGCD